MNNFLMPHVAARLFDVPLMVDARKAAAILNAVGQRVTGHTVVIDRVEPLSHVAFASGRPSMGRVGDPLGRALEDEGRGDRLLPVVIDNVAVIAIEGSLVHKGKWIGASSGETSYEGIQAQVQRARRDPGVRGVVFEVDSYGGEVPGAFETAAMIRQLSAEKPTVAILTDDALSAGYLLASATRAIVMPETGSAGSIGVITMHIDISASVEAQGIKVTLIYSGEHKADLYPFGALPEGAAERLQAGVDAVRDRFAEDVAAGRGPRFDKSAALATEAVMFRAAEALALGMIDGIGHPSQAFDQFVTLVNRPS